MLWYILKLIVLLPLIGALIWGSLKLAQKMLCLNFMAGKSSCRFRARACRAWPKHLRAMQ